MDNEILSGNIYKGMIRMAVPLMLFSLMNTFYNVVDTFFVAKIGELQLGAVSLISPVMECGNAFAMGLSVAGIALISREIGSNQPNEGRKIAAHLIYIAVILGILIGLMMVLGSKQILAFLSTPADIYQDSLNYLLGISLDFLFLFILTIYHAIRISDGDSVSGVKINTISSIFNCILDPVMIFGFHLGTFGAAMATTFSKMLVTPYVIYCLYARKDVIQTKLEFDYVRRILKVGIPSSLGSFLSSFGFILMNKSIVSYGSIVLSAYGLGNKISALFGIPNNGIGSALATYTGQNIGAKNYSRVRETFRKCMLMSFVISIVFMVLGFTTMKYMIYFFISHPTQELYHYTYEYGMYCIGTMFLMAWYMNLEGLYNGSGNTKCSLILSTFRLWGLRIPMIYLFSKYTALGPTGIWIAMCSSNLITCLLGIVLQYKVVYSKFFTLKT